jgi:hypothetical protein
VAVFEQAQSEGPVRWWADAGAREQQAQGVGVSHCQARSTMALSMPPIRKKCPHNREKYVCRQCGGAGICEHE